MEKINEEKNAVTDIAEQQNAIGALIESERSKSTLISNLPGVAYRSESDEELTMVFISDGCYELTGYTSEELLMKEPSYYDLILPDYRDALFEKWKYDFGLNVITPDEYPIRTASGEIKWVWEQYQEVYDANNNKLATEGLIIDITERRRVEKELKESEERFKIIFEEAPLGVGIFDSTTGMAYQVNKKFAEIIGRTRAEALSLNWSEYTYPADIQENLEKLNLMNQGLLTGFSLEKRFLKKDGTIIWVNITITPFQYGNNSDQAIYVWLKISVNGRNMRQIYS
jgi:PAS domain S-box-containing protein